MVTETTDQELMQAIGAGDEDAFRELVRRYQDSVYGTAFKMLGRYHHEAEDVAQQVFIRVFKAAKRYRPEATVKTWLMTITRNCIFTQLKKSGRREGRNTPLEPIVDGEEVAMPLPDPEAPDAAEALLRKEMAEQLQAAMDRLPPQQRAALTLRQYEQMDYESIAGALGTTIPAVKSLIFRARDTLRSELDEYLNASK